MSTHPKGKEHELGIKCSGPWSWQWCTRLQAPLPSLLNSSATEQVIMLSDALAIFVCGWLPPALYPALGSWDVNSIRTSRSVAKVFSSREHPESTTQSTKPPPPLASRPLFPSDLKEPSWDVTFLSFKRLWMLQKHKSGKWGTQSLLPVEHCRASCYLLYLVASYDWLFFWSVLICLSFKPHARRPFQCTTGRISRGCAVLGENMGSICLQLAVHYDGGGHASSGELSPAPHQRMQTSNTTKP